MSKNVILFLTNPDSVYRSKMCLKNFKQLLKLGYDIISLSVTDFLPRYIVDNSKYLIYDYTSHKCDKKFYYECYKNSNDNGDFMYDINDHHKVILYHTTHFPSILRNYRSLITYAKSLGYDNYFYIEDDHYIDDRDLVLVRDYFLKLSQYDFIAFNFTNEQPVYCTYFNFGKVDFMFDIAKNFAYTEYEYKIKNPDIYGTFFENVFTTLIETHRSEHSTVLKQLRGEDVFVNSSINQVYSYRNLIYDGRCNIIPDVINNKTVLYYSGISLKENVDLKIYVNGSMIEHTTVYPNCWYFCYVDDSFIDNTKIIINDKLTKTFDSSQNILYNGELILNNT